MPLLAFYAFFAAVMYPLAGVLHPHGLQQALATVVPVGLHGLVKVRCGFPQWQRQWLSSFEGFALPHRRRTPARWRSACVPACLPSIMPQAVCPGKKAPLLPDSSGRSLAP